MYRCRDAKLTDAAATNFLVIGEGGFGVFTVHASDVLQADLFRAGGFALRVVGAVTEQEFIVRLHHV